MVNNLTMNLFFLDFEKNKLIEQKELLSFSLNK